MWACFARLGWADGSVEPYEFTDIDRTVVSRRITRGIALGAAQ
jgi:hypothetical protein